jgi:uncharacterized protein DUF3443
MSARHGWARGFKSLPGLALVAASLIAMPACSSVKSGSGAGSGPGGGGGGVTNTLAVQVTSGPTGNSLNTLFASVEICIHGTTTCQTISDVLVDTGSNGLRLLGSQVSLSLPASTNVSGNPLGECVVFADTTFGWGSVNIADINLAGEKAASVPIQILSASGFAPPPAACNGSQQLDSQATLHANGILGVGLFVQDCGNACATAPPPPNAYFSCIVNVCSPATVALANQLQNPVALFTTDNNGVLINLPTVGSSGVATLSGSLIFGIGTQSNNALGTATVYTTSPAGNYTATYNSVAYTQSFVDSGSNAFFFLDSGTSGLATCAMDAAFYCPAATANFMVTTTGLNANSGTVTFSIGNAQTLFAANPTFAVFGNVGGPFAGLFDFGLSFFYGRPVFTAIEGKTTPGGIGPYWAY